MRITASSLQALFDYNYWANGLLLDACVALAAEDWDRQLGHSWGSIHGVMAHMLAADSLWLARWRGESSTALRQPDEFPTLADLRRAWTGVEADVRAFIDGCDDARLCADLTYRNTRGQRFTFPLGLLMLHLANHGTHHRGELAGMLSTLQVPHPEDDLLFYMIEKRAGSG